MRPPSTLLALGLLLLASPGSGIAPGSLKCIPGIHRFSATGSKTAYFHCDEDATIPTKKECEEGQVYSMKRQKCTRADDTADVLPLNEKALGRNFVLGAFYDARTNIVFPEASFWSQKVLNDSSHTYNHLEVNLDVQSLIRKYDRTKYFDISASLSVDFMAGAVHVAGSAGFLKEDITSEEESNVAMVYHTTKYSKTINKHTRKSYIGECSEIKKYTHVVTSVDYGLDAVFSFRRLAKSHENAMGITGSLEISINKIPGTVIEGSGKVNMTEWEKEMWNSTTLEMFGDFSPETEQPPTTYEKAVAFYKKVPMMAGTPEDGYPGAQIIKVHLTPIAHMCSDAEVMYNEISEGMLVRVSEVLDELQQLEVKVNGMMISDMAVMFNPLKVNFGVYKTALRSYSIHFKSQLQKILPLIRDADNPAGEQALMDLLKEHQASQFEFDTSNNFLIDRKRELNAVKFLVETVLESNVAVADFESATDVAFIFGKDQLVFLELNILSDTTNTESFLNKAPTNESEFWYNKPDVNGHVGNLLQSLRAFSDVNSDDDNYGFMVKLNLFNNTQPIVLSSLLAGYVTSNEFINPPTPPTSTVLKISPKGFTFNVLKSNEFITQLKITITNVINLRTYDTIRKVPGNIPVGSNIEVSIEGLKTAHMYSFHVQYMTAVGTGPPSQDSAKPFSTRPTSAPQDLLMTDVKRHNITVTWQQPAIIAEVVTFSDIKYRTTTKGSNGFHSVQLHSNTERSLILADPAPDTKFTFEVVAILPRDLLFNDTEGIHPLNDSYIKIPREIDVICESTVTTLTVFSLPDPPKMSQVVLDEVDKDSAVVRWEPNTLADGAELIHYVLMYTAMNENGTKAFEGTEKYLVLTATEINLQELSPGSVYGARVKVKTTEGESEFSSSLLFMTLFDKDDITVAREHIMAEIGNLMDEVSDHVTYCAWWQPQGSNIFLVDDSCDGGSMNADGVFIAKRAGLYQVSVSLQMQVDPGTSINVWVNHNGTNKEESRIQAENSVAGFTYKIDNTGRSITVELAEGDSITLFTDVNTNTYLGIQVPFCVSSVKI